MSETRTWKDITSYSRDRDRIPHWWETRIASLRLAVGDEHIYHTTGTWLILCSPWWNESTPIPGATDEQSAKEIALKMVRSKCQEIMQALAEEKRDV